MEKDNTITTLVDKIFSFTRMNGYTYSDISRKMNVTRAMITNYRKSGNVQLSTAIRMAEAGDCEIILRNKRNGMEMKL